jgi:hypothetical protein
MPNQDMFKVLREKGISESQYLSAQMLIEFRLNFLLLALMVVALWPLKGSAAYVGVVGIAMYGVLRAWYQSLRLRLEAVRYIEQQHSMLVASKLRMCVVAVNAFKGAALASFFASMFVMGFSSIA